MRVVTLMSPTPLSSRRKSSEVRVSTLPEGITSNTPSLI